MLAARTVRSNNRSGVSGVEWNAEKRKWRASICFMDRRRHLGAYEKFDDAVAVRKQVGAELIELFLVEYGRKPMA